MMRTTLRLTLVLGCLAALGAQAQSVLAPNDPAPPIRAKNLRDGTMAAPDWSTHKASVVIFWATWCEPCREELPRLERFKQEIGDEKLRIVAVAMDDDIDTPAVLEFADELGLTYPIVHDKKHKTVSMWGGIGVLPTSFLISSEGKVLRRYVSANPLMVDTMTRDVADYLAGRPLGPLATVPPPPTSGNRQ